MEGEKHISIFAFIENGKGEILLVFNKKEERSEGGFTKPAKWGLPGGHVEPGEKESEALKREVEEETGISKDLLEIDSTDLFWEEKQNREAGGGSHYVMVLRVRLKIPSTEIILQPLDTADVEKAEWKAEDELPPDLYRSHLKRIQHFAPEAKVGY